MTISVRRAHVAARIELACQVAPTGLALLAEVGALVAQVVPHDQRDLQVYDPEAMIPVAAVSDTAVPMDVRLAHCEIEQQGQDVAPFRELARRRPAVLTLNRATGGRPQDSRRFRELLAPAGIRHELRAALVCQGSCWGAMMLFRHSGADFTGAEQRWLSAVTAAVALGLRRLARTAPCSRAVPGAGIVSVSPGARPRAVTGAGESWLEGLGNPLAVEAAATRARHQGTAVVRVVSAFGWAVLEADRNRDGDDIAVIIRSGVGAAVMPVLALAYGLTPAQRSVVALTMHGRTSREVGNLLMISEETVRDHLRAVYRKTDTTSSGTLRHRLTLETWSGVARPPAPGPPQ